MRSTLLQYLAFCTIILSSGWIAVQVFDFFKPSPSPLFPESGIKTSREYSVEALVKDIFAKGTCENISNVRAIGNINGIGYFEQGSNIIGMERGIILSTGPISNAEGPNTNTDMSGNFNDAAGDPDLEMLATNRMFDAVGLEFDFVPLDSFVQFRYVFASEEYCEFVGSVYNDVFGFFISGPGINGTFINNAKNVALIPGTADYVAINSVNHTYNSPYFVRNELARDAQECGIAPLVNSPYWQLIEYDGFTRQLTASLQLISCQTYHIRLVVSDVADKYYDSAVFLEAESFNIGGTVTISPQVVNTNENIALEGCSDAFFVFERSKIENIDKALTVNFKIAPSSTAVEAIDFERLPRAITIPPREQSVRLPVHFLNDGIPEPPKSLTIELDIPCACYVGTATLQVQDAPGLQIELPDAAVCKNTPTALKPTIRGGTPPYSYRWSNGAVTESITISAAAVSTYALTVTDRCGNTAFDTKHIRLVEAPIASLSGYAEICSGDTAYLEVEFTGAAPWRFTYFLNGTAQGTFENITQTKFSFPVDQQGVYTISKINDRNCEGIAQGFGELVLTDVGMDAALQHVSCFDGNDGSITIQAYGGTPPYRYRWAHNSAENPTLFGLAAGIYTLSITDAAGCTNNFDIEIRSPEALQAVVFTCEDLTDPDFQFSARGGTPPYQYSVDGIFFEKESIFERLLPGETYALTVVDANGCSLEQTLNMPPVYDKMVELPATLEVKIGSVYDLRPKLNLPEALVANIRWLPNTNLSCQDCLMPQAHAFTDQQYTIRITDIFGCTGEATIQIKVDKEVDVFIPDAFSPTGNLVNDRFTIFANPLQVQQVLSFQVFDRWGSLVFEQRDFPINDEQYGWDGTVRGQLSNPGVFTYLARLALIDGSETLRKGQTILMR